MKISIPSLEAISHHFIKMVMRFPLALISAFLGTFAAIMETYPARSWDDPFWIKIILCCILGLVFGISVSTFAESKELKKGQTAILRLILLLLLTGYFFILPEHLLMGDWYRFLLISALGHLLVALAPFYRKGNINEFWLYNKSLFLRFLTAVLYAAVLFAGISIALLALNELFGFNIDGQVYIRIWLVVVGIFNTCIFLAGIPEKPLITDQENSYPKGLKIFTQFVLIPLVSLYVVILLAYELKIAITWELPRGWVTNLIIAFAVFGILSLLLVFPVRKESGNRWITIYTKVYYRVMLPLLLLLFIAIGTRIRNYGFTEERFWVALIGIWLLFVAGYFIFSKKENIKLIPLSLAGTIIITLILVSPVCIQSQQNRLTVILKRNALLKAGKMQDATNPVSLKDKQEITSIIKYLYATHGIHSLQSFFKKDLSEFDPKMNAYNFSDSLLRTVGLHAVNTFSLPSDKDGNFYFNVQVNQPYVIPTDGYDYYLSVPFISMHTPINNYVWQLGQQELTLSIKENNNLLLNLNGKEAILIPMDSLLKKIIKRYSQEGNFELAPEEATIRAANNRIKVKLFMKSLSGHAKGRKPDYSQSTFDIICFIKLKD